MREKKTSRDMSFKKHDHTICKDSSMKALEERCFEENLKLTPLRRKVFEILIKDHKPLGAYQILDLLREAGFSSKPPIAYRVLDFLIEQGFAHKIKGLNAFIACSHLGSSHVPAFMICRLCDKVAEIDDQRTKLELNGTSSPLGFKIEETSVEMTGICTLCYNKQSA
jgi:Fur family zinc uptake transcriptional regulator